MSDVGLVAKAVAEIAKVVGNWQVSAERRRMQKAIATAEEYIFVNEGAGEYENIPLAKKGKLLRHFCKRFFTLNN